MRFEREAEGIYKYGKKRVFMKIEKDQIIIRVGGGYLTIDEFIEQYCDLNLGGSSANGESAKRRLFGLIYGGNCHGSKDFKTFYFTQKTVMNNNNSLGGANVANNNDITTNHAKSSMAELMAEDTQQTSSTACINIRDAV